MHERLFAIPAGHAQLLRRNQDEHGKHGYLIAYDIACPRRLGRVQRLLSKTALRVQYSIYAAWLNNRELDEMLEEIALRIDAEADDIRIYPLAGHSQAAERNENRMDGDFPDGVLLVI